jgi:hypothetical protein
MWRGTRAGWLSDAFAHKHVRVANPLCIARAFIAFTPTS